MQEALQLGPASPDTPDRDMECRVLFNLYEMSREDSKHLFSVAHWRRNIPCGISLYACTTVDVVVHL